MSEAANLDLEQFLYLTTRGRRSGLSREIEIWFTRRDDRFYVIAEYPTSNWVRNLQAHSEVSIRVAQQTLTARARALLPETDAGLIEAVQKLSSSKYGWGDGLVVELVPLPTSTQ